MRRVDWWETKVEGTDEVQICMAKLEDVHLRGWFTIVRLRTRKLLTYLEQVGEVDQHVVPCLLLSAGDVYADGYDVHAFPTAGELVFEGEGVEA